MKSYNTVLLAALAIGSSASAIRPRNATVYDCAQAVAGTAQGTAFMSSARADCSSNVVSYTVLTVTVTPEASTLTQVVDVQSTALASTTEISTGSTTATSYILSTEVDYEVATAYSTSTEVIRVTYPVTYTPAVSTATSVITFTASLTSTVTSYTPTATAVLKRDQQAREVEARDDEGDVDGLCEIVVDEVWVDVAVETTSSTSVEPTSTIPTYASACTSWAEYVTACSSAGVSQVTSTVSVTLPADTYTVILPSTSITTQIATISTVVFENFTTFQTIVASTTQTSTVTLPLVTMSISTVYSTTTLSASTAYVYQTSTVTGSAVALQTVTAAVPTFKLAMVPATGGSTIYMKVAIGDGIAYTGTTDISLASVFTIDSSNRLVTTAADPEIACSYNTIASYYMEGVRHTWLDARPQYFTALKCAINSDLTLTCAFNTATTFSYVSSQNAFWYTTPTYTSAPKYIANVIVQ